MRQMRRNFILQIYIYVYELRFLRLWPFVACSKKIKGVATNLISNFHYSVFVLVWVLPEMKMVKSDDIRSNWKYLQNSMFRGHSLASDGQFLCEQCIKIEWHYENISKNIERRINFKCRPLKMAAHTEAKCHRQLSVHPTPPWKKYYLFSWRAPMYSFF